MVLSFPIPELLQFRLMPIFRHEARRALKDAKLLSGKSLIAEIMGAINQGSGNEKR